MRRWLMPFPRFVAPTSAPPPLAITECHIDEAFFFIEQHLCREARWQHPSAPAARSHRGTKSGSVDAPFCNSDSSAGACAIARLCSESTEPHPTCWNSLSTRTTIRNVLLRKMLPDALPLLVGEPNHPTFLED